MAGKYGETLLRSTQTNLKRKSFTSSPFYNLEEEEKMSESENLEIS